MQQSILINNQITLFNCSLVNKGVLNGPIQFESARKNLAFARIARKN